MDGVNDGLLKKLQIVHNAAARVVTGVRKFDHISPVLCELHWLSVRHRITYKLATIINKCLHGVAPSYLETTECLSQPWGVDDTFDLLTVDASLSQEPQEPGLCSEHVTCGRWSSCVEQFTSETKNLSLIHI